MQLCAQHELRDSDQEIFLAEAAKARSGKLVYNRMAQRIREKLEELYAFDLTHMACEIACLGLDQGKLSQDDLLLLARNRVPIGDVLKREFEWAVLGSPDEYDDDEEGEGDDDSEHDSGVDPFDSVCQPDHEPENYWSGFYIQMIRDLCAYADALFAGFWNNCRLLADHYGAQGTRRKTTLALMGKEPVDVWDPHRKRRGLVKEVDGGKDDAEAAADYEWDLLGDLDFVMVMSLAMSLAKNQDLTRWTANLTLGASKSTVTILKHLEEGDKGQMVEQATELYGSRTSGLATLLLNQMPRWALKSISTEKGSSAPVFGSPKRRLFITAIRPNIYACEWGLIACIPRYYSWKSLRTRAKRDFAPLMAAMEQNQPRLERSVENVYSYARRIRDELRAERWKDHVALERVQELTGLTEREVYQRLGYKGRGGEGKGKAGRASKAARSSDEKDRTREGKGKPRKAGKGSSDVAV